MVTSSREDFGNVSYVLGITSIVLAFFTPLAALIFGIIGMTLGKRQSTTLSKKATKLSVIGIILSIIVLVIVVVVALVFGGSGLVGTFPVE